MGYPYSINKSITIKLNDIQGESKKPVKYFVDGLMDIKCIIIKESDDRILIKECVEFSSNTSRLKNLNRGEIIFETSKDTLKIKSRIVVFEHFIFFIGIMIFFVFGIINFKEAPEILGVSMITLLASFVFLYLIPLMTFYSFFNDTISKIKKK